MEVPDHLSCLPAGLIQAYRAARYEVRGAAPFVLQVGRRSADLASGLAARRAAGALFITAWNPAGQVLAPAANAKRQARLLTDLRLAGRDGCEAFGAYAEDPSRGEPSVLVWDVDRADAAIWGRRQGQNAVVWAGPDAVPRLLLLR